jgi:TolB-like protein/Tfp pilus assembly protein PilF
MCDALRAVGVEVWFDQNELVGGDAWDAKIRRQIGSCALFVPLISANTQARLEGYFRLEWKLAAQRTHTMADEKTFLLPVVIDATRDAEAKVPPEFKAVQWTRLERGETPPAFCARVKTLLGLGVAPVSDRRLEADNADDARHNAGQRPALPRKRSPFALTAGAFAIVVAIGTALFVAKRSDRPAAATAPASVTLPTAPQVDPKSIAVLPFANRSADTENEFFTDGIHEDILTNLAHIHELHVVSRTSVMDYRVTAKKIPQIARELNVAYILEGSVQRAGKKVHVTGQLIRAATDEHVWAESYDRDLTNVFAIQAELAKAIAGELRAVLSPQEKALLERRLTDNPAAYDLYLKARALRRGAWGQETLKSAEAMLSRAVEFDPGFAEAWAELADCRAQFAFDDFDHSAETRTAGRAALDKALQLAPESPAVIGSAGDYYFHSNRDYARAAEQYRRLAQLQPNSALVYESLASIQRRQGHWAEALADAQRAAALDPRSRECFGMLYSLLIDARRYAEAETLARKRKEIAPDEIEPGYRLAVAAYFGRGSTAEAQAFAHQAFSPELQSRAFAQRKRLARLCGNFAEAAQLDREQPFSDNDWSKWSQDVLSAVTIANTGDLPGARTRAEAALPAMQAELVRQPQNSWLHAWLGQAYALVGDKERALLHARKAVEILPGSRDAVYGLDNEIMAASVFAWVGEKDHAFVELARILRTPHGGGTRVARNGISEDNTMISWKPLLDDPRFEALLNDPKNNAPLF